MHGTVDSPNPEEISPLVPEARRRAGASKPAGQPPLDGPRLSEPAVAPKVRALVKTNLAARAEALPAALGKVSTHEAAVCFRSLSVMLQSGVPLAHSIELLAEGSDVGLAHALMQVASAMREGASMSRAMALRTDVFGHMAVALIEAGEMTGRLDVILDRLATFLESRSRLEMKVKSALTYPLVVFAISLVILIVMPLFLMDGIFAVMRDLQVDLPLSTRLLMRAYGLIRSPWTWLAGAIVAVGAVRGIRRLTSAPDFRLRLHARLLRLPIVGIVLQKVATALFARTLETMYACGIPVMRALEMAARASSNLEFERRIRAVIPKIGEGRLLHVALRDTQLFPRLDIQFVNAGEESGQLPDMLAQMAKMAELEVDHRLETALAALEPLVLWIMGCLVAFLCLAVLQPFLGVMESLTP